MLLARLRSGLEALRFLARRCAAAVDGAPGPGTGHDRAARPCWGAAILARSNRANAPISVAIRLDRLDYAGALHDPVAALVFCSPQNVDFNVVGGRVIVRDGQLQTVDVPALVERHNRAARRLMNA